MDSTEEQLTEIAATLDVVVIRYFLDRVQVCAHCEVPPQQIERRTSELLDTRRAFTIIWRDLAPLDLDGTGDKPARCSRFADRMHYLLQGSGVIA